MILEIHRHDYSNPIPYIDEPPLTGVHEKKIGFRFGGQLIFITKDKPTILGKYKVFRLDIIDMIINQPFINQVGYDLTHGYSKVEATVPGFCKHGLHAAIETLGKTRREKKPLQLGVLNSLVD